MLIQGQVGPINPKTSQSPNQQLPVRQGQMGDVVTSELHGRYYESAYRNTLFCAANQNTINTTVAFANVYTGLCLSNPISSTVNLVLNKVGYSFTVAFAATATLGLMGGANTANAVIQTVPVTPKSAVVGVGGSGGLGSTPQPVGAQAQVASACSFLFHNPYLITTFGTAETGAITTTPGMASDIVDMEGSVVIAPGGWVAFYTSTMSPANSSVFSFQWEEVPL